MRLHKLKKLGSLLFIQGIGIFVDILHKYIYLLSLLSCALHLNIITIIQYVAQIYLPILGMISIVINSFNFIGSQLKVYIIKLVMKSSIKIMDQRRMTESFDNVEQQNDQSIIQQLNLLDSDFLNSKIDKVTSFIYNCSPSQNSLQFVNNQLLTDSYNRVICPIPRTINPIPSIGSNYATKRHQKVYDQQIFLADTLLNINKNSIEQTMRLENLLLQKRLSEKKHKRSQFQRFRAQSKPSYQFNRLQSKNQYLSHKKYNKVQQKHSKKNTKHDLEYKTSDTIQLLDQLISHLPVCHICNFTCVYMANSNKKTQFVCKKCHQKNQSYSVMGILLDLQNKTQFEKQMSLLQNILNLINSKMQNLRKTLQQLLQLKQKIITIKALNRENIKQIDQARKYYKKHVLHFDKNNFTKLSQLIPTQYLDLMHQWKSISELQQPPDQSIYQQINKIMPLIFQKDNNSKPLESIRKILNLQHEQRQKQTSGAKIQDESDVVTYMVDQNSAFQNSKNICLKFEHKKTSRELQNLFDNISKSTNSLQFWYNHKIHSHVSAESFPFLQTIACFPNIQKVNVRIDNLKQFKDLIKMPSTLTRKKQFKVTITRHVFSKQKLRLPLNFYNDLMTKLGPELVRFSINFPEQINSPAQINYLNLVKLQKLCWFKIVRGEKDHEAQRKILIESYQFKRLNKIKYLFRRQLLLRICAINIANKYSDKNCLQNVLAQSICKFVI